MPARDVDAEVRLPHVSGEDARVVRARLATIVERDGDRAVGPAATDGWNWSVGTPGVSTLSFTVTGSDQWLPPSVDWVNLTSIWVPSQSSYVM